MTLYAESSAVLAWLLEEPRAPEILEELAAAHLVIASDLTLVETDRVLIRATALGDLSAADAASRRAELHRAAAHWTVVRLGEEIIDRARRRLPIEPVRTLDALHLASALSARSAVPDVAVLSLDSAVRANARALGFEVRPALP